MRKPMRLLWSDTCLEQPNGVIITMRKSRRDSDFIMASGCVLHEA